jgi:hypothetical protein
MRDAGGGHPNVRPPYGRSATDAGWVTVAVMRRGAAVHVDVIDDGRSGAPALA